MYRLPKSNPLSGLIQSVDNLENNTCIPFDQANTDYQTFKAQINAQVATLQDADGNAMSADKAIAFVSTLP